MAELKPFEVIMRIDYAASKGPEVVAHAEKVQELVRCVDCKWNMSCGYISARSFKEWKDWFCADGERKVQE